MASRMSSTGVQFRTTAFPLRNAALAPELR
jgi:hypothetical protein